MIEKYREEDAIWIFSQEASIPVRLTVPVNERGGYRGLNKRVDAY